MMTRRSWLSHVLGPAAFTGGLLAVNGASARSEAPEFVGIDGWLNADAPLKMAGLRGKVVLVEFGTYTCINWRRTLPYVSRWHSEYGPQGLQIICIHTPEFDFERNRPNVESAIRELRVDYPIAQDNEFRTWRAWDNRAWPAFYLVDGDGQVRLVREGEGNAQEIEGAIRSLLRLARTGAGEHPGDDADLSRVGTPEMYFGSQHPTPQDRAQSPRQGEAAYVFASSGRPRAERVPTGWKLGAWGGSAGASLARRPGSDALLGGKTVSGRWGVAPRTCPRQYRWRRRTHDQCRHVDTLHAVRQR